MAEAATLQIVITAQDMASAKMKEIQGQAATMGSSFTSAGKGLGDLGRAIMPVSVALLGIGAYSIKSAMDFQDSMTQIQTQAGASAGEVKKMTGAVLDMSTQVGTKPKELADGLFFVESAGFRGAKALDVLRLAAEGAQIGNASLADTAKTLTSIMNTNIRGAQSASEAMGNLNAIVGAGEMHFQDLNAAIGTGFFAAAASFGVSLQSAGAALADLTKLGMPADAAATRLRMTMTLMATPTAEAQKVLESAGFTMNDVKTSSQSMTDALSAAHVKTSDMAADLQKPNGFLVAIQDMEKHLNNAGIKGNDAASLIAKAFGGGRASGPILAMVQNNEALAQSFDSIRTGADKFGQDWKTRTEDASFKWDVFKATVQKEAIVIGEALLPKVTTALTHISNAITDVMKWWEALSPKAKKAISDIAVGLAVGGPILVGLGAVAKAIGAIVTILSGPLGIAILVLGSLALVAFLLRKHFKEWGDEIDNVWKKFSQSSPVIILTQYFTQVFIPALKAIWNSIKKDLGPALESLFKAFEKLFKAEHFGTILKILGGIIGGALLLAIYIILAAFNLWIKTISFAIKIFSDIISWIAQVIKWFGNLAGGIYNAIGVVIAIFRNLIPATIDVVKIVVGTFASLELSILRLFAGAVSWLWKAGTDLIRGLVNGIGAAAAWLWSGLSNTLSAVGRFFAGVGGWLYNAGKDLLLGFINGINSMAGSVFGTVRNIGSKAVDALKGVLKIFSPSAVFADLGQNVGAGLAQGIKASQGLVEMASAKLGQSSITSAKTGVSGNMVQPFQAPLNSSSTSSTTANSNNNVTVSIQNVNLADASAVQEFFKQLDRDNILVSKGLTPARGM